jgi:hypothetical protein
VFYAERKKAAFGLLFFRLRLRLHFASRREPDAEREQANRCRHDTVVAGKT